VGRHGLTLRCSNYRLRPYIQMKAPNIQNSGGGGGKSSKMVDTENILQTVPGVNPSRTVFSFLDQKKVFGEKKLYF